MQMPAEDWPEAPAPLAAPVIDTHTHLDVHDRHLHGDVRPNPDDLLARAREVNVTKVVQIGCDVESAEWSVAMAQDHPEVVVGVALHPNDAARIVERNGHAELERAWERIDALARDHTVRAVGETGLDYYRTQMPQAMPSSRSPSAGTSPWQTNSTRRWSSTTATRTRM